MLASPGMLQSGMSRELLELWAPDNRNGLIVTGYSVEGTLARVSVELTTMNLCALFMYIQHGKCNCLCIPIYHGLVTAPKLYALSSTIYNTHFRD